MSDELKAGATYFIAVFFVAFVIGIIRVLVLVPKIGEVIAVSLEAPVVLSVSWFAARWAAGRFRLTHTISSRLTMGGFAFALLMIVELAMATLIFGQPLSDYFAAVGSLPGAIGLGTQMIFAFIPLIQRTRQ